MGGLRVPGKGQAASMLAELNAEHAKETGHAKETEDVPSPLPPTEGASEVASTVPIDAGSATENTTDIISDRTTGSTTQNTTDHTTDNKVSSSVVRTTILPTIFPVEPEDDPIRAGTLSLLLMPLKTPLSDKRSWVVTSIKAHTDIWDRVGHVAKLLGKDRQDVVAEALMDYFAKVVREEQGK